MARSLDAFKVEVDPEAFLKPILDGPIAAYEEVRVEDRRVANVEDEYPITKNVSG